jgi:BirA family biotin operon repressor/biotin-[acetyl-CoA-carboxylase] ligase
MTQSFTPTILRFDSLPSTNTEAARQAELGAPEGLCIVAHEQTQGRGRRDRVWVSPKDAGLYLSVVLRPRLDASAWPLIPLMAAVAVHDALALECGPRVEIKWPNDLLWQGRKLCGILAETVETQRGRAIILGIGINLHEDAYPPELRDVATSVEAAIAKRPDREALLRALLRALAARYELLQSVVGARAVVDEWEARSGFARGRRVRVSLEGHAFEGTTRGLEPDGALRVETDDATIHVVRAGDVTALRPR